MNKCRSLKNQLFKQATRILTIFSCLIVVLIFISLLMKSAPILEQKNIIDQIFSDMWHPLKGEFGFLPFIVGTLLVTLIALVLAVPLSILAAIYLSEYVHGMVLKYIKSFIDVLAGIPSVIFGLWGVLVVVPFIKDLVAPVFGAFSTGYSILAGGIVLALMIVPVILHVTLEVLQTVPLDLREAALSLGTTKWQAIKHVVLRKAFPGILAGVILGVSRAFGETMAVMMVCGNVAKIPSSLLDPGYPLPALIANNYGEMLSVPLYDSALFLAAFILFLIIFVFNIISRIILYRMERNMI